MTETIHAVCADTKVGRRIAAQIEAYRSEVTLFQPDPFEMTVCECGTVGCEKCGDWE